MIFLQYAQKELYKENSIDNAYPIIDKKKYNADY